MFENTTGADDDAASLVPPGTPVLDMTGQPIGSIAGEPAEDGYLPVYKGLFFTRLIYIPAVYVTHTDSYGVHLGLRKGDLASDSHAYLMCAVALPAC